MTDTPESIGTDTKSVAERDRIDLNIEISGQQVGRSQRFFSENLDDIHFGENSEKKKHERHMTMLQLLLESDARYAAAYQRLLDSLDNADRAAERALADIDEQTTIAQGEVDAMLDKAAKTGDGTRVFRDADGSVYSEDGRKLSDGEAEGITFEDGAPTYEEYRKARERLETARRQREEIERYQRDVLNPARDRINDPDNPPSPEEIEDLRKRIETQRPDVLKKYLDQGSAIAAQAAPVTVAQEIAGNAVANTPPMGNHFDKATKGDIPSLDELDALPITRTRAPAANAAPVV